MTNPAPHEGEIELLPCPFCGGEAEQCSNLERHRGGPMFWVLCTTCHASPGDRSTETEAIAAWNTRQPASAAPGEAYPECTCRDPKGGHYDRCPTLRHPFHPDGRPKVAPVQGWTPGIPWSLHLEAYDAYRAKWSSQPALIDIDKRGCRGGFGIEELDEFVPGWRERTLEINALRAEVARLSTALSAAPRPAEGSAEKAIKLIDDFFAPWGSWKTEWWEELSGDKEWSADEMLRIVREHLQRALSQGQGSYAEGIEAAAKVADRWQLDVVAQDIRELLPENQGEDRALGDTSGGEG